MVGGTAVVADVAPGEFASVVSAGILQIVAMRWWPSEKTDRWTMMLGLTVF
jgi:hypothetical protein